MAEFLMNHYSSTVPEKVRNEYRKLCLAHLEAVHEKAYVQEVRTLLETMYRSAKGKKV
jgi:hypothetical protein